MVLGGHMERSAGFPAGWRPYITIFFDGALGVRIFFVLSGFLITHLLLTDEAAHGELRLGTFYRRRALRILPVYYAFVLVFFILDLTTPLDTRWSQYVGALTFTKNMLPAGWYDGHLWSLAVEQQFYLLWPIALLLLTPRSRFQFAAVLIGLAACFRVGFYAADLRSWYYYSLFTNMDSLMFGGAAAMLVQLWPDRLRRALDYRPTLLRVCCLGAIVLIWRLTAAARLGLFTVPLGCTIQNVAATFLILSYTYKTTGIGYGILNLPLLRAVGVLSFSLYVWQPLFFAKEGDWGPHHPFFLRFPINLAAIFIVATMSYFAIERPFFRARSKLRAVG